MRHALPVNVQTCPLLAALRAALLAVVAAAQIAATDGAPDAAVRAGLTEFVEWCYPAGGACALIPPVEVVSQGPDSARVRYRIRCADGDRALEAVLRTRQKDGVWQVAGGFEADEPFARKATGGDDALGIVVPARALETSPPAYPEPLGRARPIGDTRVEILVEVEPDGSAGRARPLRGPDPDFGMRRAAIEAVARWRFTPATLAGRALRSFVAVEVPFPGLPPESRDWVHRALFRLEGLAASDPSSQPQDWGLVPAATLPPKVRRALHEAEVGALTAPIEAAGGPYRLRKRGEVYYAVRVAPDGSASAPLIVHQVAPPPGEVLRRAIEDDLADFFAEDRRLAYMNEASRLMGMKQTRTSAGRLLIHTDVLDRSEVDILAAVVGEVVRVHERFWRDVPLRPLHQQIFVYALARKVDHDRLHEIWHRGAGARGPMTPPEPTPRGIAGEYIRASRILAMACEKYDGHLPVPTLIHETIHMLDNERVYGAGVKPSQWLKEGLATYFASSHLDGRLRLDPGRIRRSGTIIAGTVRLQFDPRVPLREHRRESGLKGPVPLRALLRARGGEPFWTGDEGARSYTASWTLVHFLLHGEEGERRRAFLEYAALEARGAGGAETFTRLVGEDLEALERAWHAYEAAL